MLSQKNRFRTVGHQALGRLELTLVVNISAILCYTSYLLLLAGEQNVIHKHLA